LGQDLVRVNGPLIILERDNFILNRHCERSEAIQWRAHGLLRFARNDDVDQTNLISL
jgi:hypothetical protein